MRKCQAKIVGGLVDDVCGARVACFGSVDHVFGGELCSFTQDGRKRFALSGRCGFPSGADDPAGRGVIFEAAAFAAIAQWAVVWLNCDMSDFAGRAVYPMCNGTVYDNAAADSGADRNHDQIGSASPGTPPHFAEGCGICVIFDEDTDTRGRFHLYSQLGALPMEIDRMVDNPGFSIDRSGHPDADAKQVGFGDVGLLQELSNHLGCSPNHAVCALFNQRRLLQLGQNSARYRQKPHLNARSANINPNDEAVVHELFTPNIHISENYACAYLIMSAIA